MPELHSNGSYDPYLAQLFNPLGGAQFNPGLYGAAGANGIGGWGGIGAGAVPNLAGQAQSPLGAQSPWGVQSPFSALYPAVQPASNPVQSLIAIQLAQQIVARQAAQAIQCAQALQILLQQALSQAMQPSAPFRFGLAA